MTIEKRPNRTADKNAPTQAPDRAPIVAPTTGPKLPGPPGVPGTERHPHPYLSRAIDDEGGEREWRAPPRGAASSLRPQGCDRVQETRP